MVKHRMFRSKKTLRKAMRKDIRDRKAMRKAGISTKGITKVIQAKRRILKSKTYWK